MKFWLRISLFLCLLGIIYWWMKRIETHRETVMTPSGDDEEPRRTAVTLDTFLHVQQLRKMRLRHFCHRFPEFSVNASDRAERLLSGLVVSPKLRMVHCKLPDVATDEWGEFIQAMEKRSDVTIRNALPDYQPPETFRKNKVLDYDLSSLEVVLRSYTKVLFVRDPLERLVSEYLLDHAGEMTFDEFIEDTMETEKEGVSSRSVMHLCHPCVIQYDYVLMYDFLRAELYHLVRRMGLPEGIQLPGSADTKSNKMPSRWLTENLFRGLSKQQTDQLSEIYAGDFAAFPLHNSLLRNNSLRIIR